MAILLILVLILFILQSYHSHPVLRVLTHRILNYFSYCTHPSHPELILHICSDPSHALLILLILYSSFSFFVHPSHTVLILLIIGQFKLHPATPRFTYERRQNIWKLKPVYNCTPRPPGLRMWGARIYGSLSLCIIAPRDPQVYECKAVKSCGCFLMS